MKGRAYYNEIDGSDRQAQFFGRIMHPVYEAVTCRAQDPDLIGPLGVGLRPMTAESERVRLVSNPDVCPTVNKGASMSIADPEILKEVEEDVIRRELEDIRSNDEQGKLRPEDVVERARDPLSPLHRRFTWDDTLAAQAYRLWQARQLISVVLISITEERPAYRAYISLGSDRRTGGEAEEAR